MAALQIVWFKRDLRIVDHRPLAAAAERGLVLPLYVVEPELWQQPDASERQWMFCQETLLELRQALADRGQPLVVRAGDVVQVLERARRQFGIDGLWSHEETGNGWTYQRDKRVGAWARRARHRLDGNPAVRGDAPDAQPQWLGQTLGGSDDGAHYAHAGRIAIAGGH